MIDVTLENFEAEVIAASMQQPVLVDFWATWCGPCKVIGPILEKLENDYGGRFKLAKIDSDQEQQLAGAFGVRSIPTVILMMGGQPVDGFMGALPEGQVRQFLDKHLPAADEAPVEEEVIEETLPGDPDAQLHKLHQALQANP
jgi:putative thioredoxin